MVFDYQAQQEYNSTYR